MTRPVSPDAAVAVLERHTRARAHRAAGLAAGMRHRLEHAKRMAERADPSTQPRLRSWAIRLADDDAGGIYDDLEAEAAAAHADRLDNLTAAELAAVAPPAPDSDDDAEMAPDQAAPIAAARRRRSMTEPPPGELTRSTPAAAHAPPGRPLPLYERADSNLDATSLPMTAGGN